MENLSVNGGALSLGIEMGSLMQRLAVTSQGLDLWEV